MIETVQQEMNYLGAEPARYLVCAKLYFKIKL